MLASERFFADFGDPLLMESGEQLMWSTEFYGGGSVGMDAGPFDFQFNLPPAGGGGYPGPRPPDVKEILSNIANNAEAALRANLEAYRQNQISGDAAITRGWQLLDGMTSAMLRYGTQGRISAAERDRRVDPSLLRWDYIAYYIDPIAQQTTGSPVTVKPLEASSAGVGGIGGFGGFGGFGGLTTRSGMMWLIVGGLVLLVLLKSRKKG